MVQRVADGSLHVVEGAMYGLTSCAADMHALMADLMSGDSRILKDKQSLDFFFEAQLQPGSAALAALRADTENYEYPAGIPRDMVDPPVNYSMGGLVAEEMLPLSHIPTRSLTWNGMPNVVWVMNREKGLGMMFATQLIPVDDPKTVDVAMKFFRDAFDHFG